ncbi:MAG: helix-turn-helix domain-containing protein [Actinomycetes bacterium]
MATLKVGSLGEYIREQRSNAQYSLRQLAELAGVSNPYLSQIERGLRKPSADILQQIAKALRISAETLYVQAGILEERAADLRVVDVILADSAISDRQKRVLVEIYESFRKENAATAEAEASAAASRTAVKKAASSRRKKTAASSRQSTRRTSTKTAKSATAKSASAKSASAKSSTSRKTTSS